MSLDKFRSFPGYRKGSDAIVEGLIPVLLLTGHLEGKKNFAHKYERVSEEDPTITKIKLAQLYIYIYIIIYYYKIIKGTKEDKLNQYTYPRY